MKIKSWTGEEVDVRPRMKISVNGCNLPLEICGVGKGLIWTNFGFYEPKECTMLHCPFQVGDEFQELQNGEWVTIKWPMTQEVLDVCKNSVYIRHTNPSLRTSEEYKV